MVDDHHERGVVGAGVDLEVACDAGKARVVARAVLDASGKQVEAIEVGADSAGERRDVRSVGLCDHLRRDGGVLDDVDVDVPQSVEEV